MVRIMWPVVKSAYTYFVYCFIYWSWCLLSPPHIAGFKWWVRLSVANVDASLAFARGRRCSGHSVLVLELNPTEGANVSHDATISC